MDKRSTEPAHDQEAELLLASRLLAHLWKQPGVVDFLEPVDYITLKLLDYPLVVTRPMDLGTIRKRVKRREYAGLEAVLRDVQLVWDNCKAYNIKDSPIVQLAVRLEQEVHRFLASCGHRDTSVPADPTPVAFEEQLELADRVKKANSSTLQEVVRLILQHCPSAVIFKSQDHMRISVQALDPATYKRLKALLNYR